MKNLKKLPTKQLEKFSNIFTQLGLVLALCVAYITLEYKTEQKTVKILKSSEFEYVMAEPDQDIIFQKEVKVTTKVADIKATPFVLDAPIEKGKDKEVETVIDLTKEEHKILNLDDIYTVDIPEENLPIEDVPFVNIEYAPVFKGCEGLSKEENKICFDQKMKQFVQRNFNISIANEIGLRAGKYKIQTQFLIDDKGNVVDIKIRAPHNRLEKEANRLIKNFQNLPLVNKEINL